MKENRHSKIVRDKYAKARPRVPEFNYSGQFSKETLEKLKEESKGIWNSQYPKRVLGKASKESIEKFEAAFNQFISKIQLDMDAEFRWWQQRKNWPRWDAETREHLLESLDNTVVKLECLLKKLHPSLRSELEICLQSRSLYNDEIHKLQIAIKRVMQEKPFKMRKKIDPFYLFTMYVAQHMFGCFNNYKICHLRKIMNILCDAVGVPILPDVVIKNARKDFQDSLNEDPAAE